MTGLPRTSEKPGPTKSPMELPAGQPMPEGCSVTSHDMYKKCRFKIFTKIFNSRKTFYCSFDRSLLTIIIIIITIPDTAFVYSVQFLVME